jgi:class 3 adenylate cyclase
MAAGRHTFLFTDLVGFTTLTAEEGDDRAAEVAVALHEHVRRLAPAHGAEAIKTLGDAVMLRCEDPALAVTLGLRIVDELDALERFPPARVGMHTGPAVGRAHDWYGTTVNIASRLCGAAGGGEVLASAATCEAAGLMPGVEFSERRLHWLKNVTEPVEAHLAHARPQACAFRRPLRRLKALFPAHPQEVLP